MQNRGKTYEKIEAIIIEQGEISSNSNSPGSTLSSPSKSTMTPQTHFQEDPAPPAAKKRRLFNKSHENDFNGDVMLRVQAHQAFRKKKSEGRVLPNLCKPVWPGALGA